MPQGKAVVSLCTNRAVTVNPENEYIDHFEFLNNLASIGVSLHELKVGVVVILLQNLTSTLEMVYRIGQDLEFVLCCLLRF